MNALQAVGLDPASRGYCVTYRPDTINFCPSCGRTHWIVGRITAECAFCATALPLREVGSQGGGMRRNSRGGILAA